MEKTINIDDKTARQIYPNAAPEWKAMLESTFTKEFFSSKITDRVTSFEDACLEAGRNPNGKFFSECRPHENANRKIELIASVLNEGEELSYKNKNQKKWYVYVIWDDSIAAYRLEAVDYEYVYARAGLGSRAAFAKRSLAEHFVQYFMDLINESLS